MGNYLKQIYKISSANYQTLKETGSLTYNGKTYKYDPNNLYLIENNLTDDYVLTGGGGSKLISELSVKHADSADTATTAETATKAAEADKATTANSATTAKYSNYMYFGNFSPNTDNPVWHNRGINGTKTELNLDKSFTYNPSTDTLKVPNIEGTITEAKKVTNKLTAGSKTYDGSTAVSLTKADLGLGNVDNTSDATKQVYEANLLWGGKNFAGAYGPIDAAMIPELGANRFAFLNPAGVEVEYSRDGGETWVDYGWTDNDKQSLFSPNGNVMQIGKDSSTGINKSNYQVRVTITTDLAKIYTVLNKFVIYCSVNGSLKCWCSIDVKTKINVDAGNNVWENKANKVTINGWSGWNIINISQIITYGNSNNPETQYQKLRFTFGGTHESEDSMRWSGLVIYKILAFGGVGWVCPSNLAKWGHAYTMDASQMCLFPSAIYSPSDIYESGIALSQRYVKQVSGKQLSTNDYTTAEKNKLAGLSNAEALTNSEIDEAIK